MCVLVPPTRAPAGRVQARCKRGASHIFQLPPHDPLQQACLTSAPGMAAQLPRVRMFLTSGLSCPMAVTREAIWERDDKV